MIKSQLLNKDGTLNEIELQKLCKKLTEQESEENTAYKKFIHVIKNLKNDSSHKTSEKDNPV